MSKPNSSSCETTTLDVVVPIYNERHVLADSIGELHGVLSSQRLPSWSIVVVDNGSTDGSEQVGRELEGRFRRFRYDRLEVKGRGLALKHAWTSTSATFSLYMDVDLSTELDVVPQVADELLDGADIVVGSRLAASSATRRSLRREILSRGYNLLVRCLFRPRSFDDAQCGFKAVRVDAVRNLLPLVVNEHWFFDTELLLLAERIGLDVRSLPVTWNEDTDSRVKIASTVMEDLRGLARVRRTLRGTRARWLALEEASP